MEAAAWWTSVPETEWPDTQTSYWSDSDGAVEIEIAMPESRRGLNKALQDLGAYFAVNMKRRAVRDRTPSASSSAGQVPGHRNALDLELEAAGGWHSKSQSQGSSPGLSGQCLRTPRYNFTCDDAPDSPDGGPVGSVEALEAE